MGHSADLGSKRLIGLAPDAWVQWITQTPTAHVTATLAADFQWVSRQTDVLLRVHDPINGDYLLLTEMQLHVDPRMPRRVHAYTALGEERYDLPVYPVVVNILPPGPGIRIPDRHERTLLGLQARCDYRVLNLWEVEAATVLATPVAPLLPFVPVLRGGDDERVVRQALSQLRAEARLSELEPLLAFFASYVLELAVVRQMMRWDMVVLRQSPWYEEILEEGRQEGRQEGLREAVRLSLEYRFGALPAEIVARLATVPAADLTALQKAAVTVDSLATFQALLPA